MAGKENIVAEYLSKGRKSTNYKFMISITIRIQLRKYKDKQNYE